MRNILKLISAALIIIAAAACHTNEIDNPDNPSKPDKPKISDNIKITAGIDQTRVGYNVSADNKNLVPFWEHDDIIFGYYGPAGKDDNASRIVFRVASVDPDTGIATLEAEDDNEWKGFLAQLKEDGDDLAVGLMYTGMNTVEKINEDDLFIGNSGSIDIYSQTGQNIPACMHSCLFDLMDAEDDDTQIVRFFFVNDCAIFKIESLTGIAEDAGLTDDQTPLTSLTVTNLSPSFDYSYYDDEQYGVAVLDFDPAGNPNPYSIDLSNGSWTVDKNGVINHPENENLLVAVAPTDNQQNILITATIAGGRQFSYLYNGNLTPGFCYRINKKDVVAKTADGQYFTSVKAAFDHASTLSSTYEDDNTVTLIKDKISSLGTHIPTNDAALSVGIGYSVVLDLNGCTLSLDGGYEADNGYDEDGDAFGIEYFTVSSSGHLTIKDSKSGGKLESDSNKHIIVNYGTVNIENGIISHNRDWSAVDNNNKLTIIDGSLSAVDWYAVQNLGEMTVSDGYISANSPGAILNENATTLKIEGGEVSSVDGIAVENKNSALTVTGGTLTSTNSNAIYSSSESSVVIGTEDGDDDDITITSYSSSSNIPAIYIQDGSFEIHSGTVKGAGAGGAVEIDSFNAEDIIYSGSPSGIIDGGTLISNAYIALTVAYSANTTFVKGGTIKSLGADTEQPAIRVENAGLIINWPENYTFPSSFYDSTSDGFPTGLPSEPLIFCQSTSPVISVNSPSGREITSSVEINGGYLFACNYQEGVSVAYANMFYKDTSSKSNRAIILKKCGKFFSTVMIAKYETTVSSTQYASKKVTSGTPPVSIDSSLLPKKDGQPVHYDWYYIY